MAGPSIAVPALGPIRLGAPQSPGGHPLPPALGSAPRARPLLAPAVMEGLSPFSSSLLGWSRCLARPPSRAAGTCWWQMVAPAALLAGVPDQSHLQAAVLPHCSAIQAIFLSSLHQQHVDQSGWELSFKG